MVSHYQFLHCLFPSRWLTAYDSQWSVRWWRREEIELLRDVAAEIEAEEYAADSEAALRTRQASLTKDQTQLLDSSLPMKNVGAGNPLSLPSAPAGSSRWESGGFSAAGEPLSVSLVFADRPGSSLKCHVW